MEYYYSDIVSFDRTLTSEYFMGSGIKGVDYYAD